MNLDADAPSVIGFLAGGVSAAAEGMNGAIPERLAYHIDSWISLGLIISALILSILLNARGARTRCLGIGLAAATCLAIPLWYAVIQTTGVIQDPRPISAPLDSAKPVMLLTQALIAGIAGTVLLALCLTARRSGQELDLEVFNRPTHYGLASRYLHWTMAILFILLIPMGIFTSMIPDDGRWYRQGYYVVHKTIGFTLLGLVVLRLTWNLVSPRPKLDAGLSAWAKAAAHSAHWALYGVLIAFPITGFMMSTYAGKLSHWFVWDTPLPFAPDDQALIVWALLHKIVLPFVFYILIFAHIAGALKHRYLDRHEDAFRRMVA